MDIPIRREGQEFVESKVRSGEYPNVEDLQRNGARASRAHDSGPQRGDDAWREDARRKIDEGFEESERGEMLDGEKVFERHRRLIESWKANGS